MSLLLSNAEFTAATEALDRGAVTPRLVAFVGALVAVRARSGTLPAGLSPTGRWDPASIEDVTQSWWAEKLLAGGLRQAFDETRTPRALSSYLDRSLRNWLIDKLRQRGVPRLRERAAQILRDDERFALFGASGGSPAHERWGLSDWQEPVPYSGDQRTLLGHAYAVGELAAVIPSGGADRAEIVIRNDQLGRLLEGLFSRINAVLSLAEIDELLRARFVEAFPPIEVPDTEAPAVVDGTADPQDEIAAEVSARQALAALSKRQATVLVLRFKEELTLEEVGQRVGCSRGTADNEIRRALVILAEQLERSDNDRLALEKLLDLAS